MDTIFPKSKGILKITEFWKTIGASRYILDVVEHGYRLPFTHLPPEPIQLKNNNSALVHHKFVHEAIEELLQSDRVIEVREPPLVINPLSVSVQSNGKKRLILDLRHVNKALQKLRIKYDDWKVAMSYFAKDSYMLSFDLKSGYHHIEIAPNDQTYLGFAWQSENQETKFYVFTVLPFGLSTAPHIFTKSLKPLVKHWRHQGICIALFLDDGWLTENSYESACNLAVKIKNDLNAAGFITNDEKSTWDPTQRLTWLGLVWDSAQGTLEITSSRINKILATIDNMTKHESLGRIHRTDYLYRSSSRKRYTYND